MRAAPRAADDHRGQHAVAAWRHRRGKATRHAARARMSVCVCRSACYYTSPSIAGLCMCACVCHCACSGSITRLRARATGHGQTRPQTRPKPRRQAAPRGLQNCPAAQEGGSRPGPQRGSHPGGTHAPQSSAHRMRKPTQPAPCVWACACSASITRLRACAIRTQPRPVCVCVLTRAGGRQGGDAGRHVEPRRRQAGRLEPGAAVTELPACTASSPGGAA